LLPVTVSAPCAAAVASGHVDTKQLPAPGGSIHVEFPGRAMITVESGADPIQVRTILESLRK